MAPILPPTEGVTTPPTDIHRAILAAARERPLDSETLTSLANRLVVSREQVIAHAWDLVEDDILTYNSSATFRVGGDQ